jgi:hypothetical protein
MALDSWKTCAGQIARPGGEGRFESNVWQVPDGTPWRAFLPAGLHDPRARRVRGVEQNTSKV